MRRDAPSAGLSLLRFVSVKNHPSELSWKVKDRTKKRRQRSGNPFIIRPLFRRVPEYEIERGEYGILLYLCTINETTSAPFCRCVACTMVARRASPLAMRRRMPGASVASLMTDTALSSRSRSRRTSVCTAKGSARCRWFATMLMRYDDADKSILEL